MPIFCWIIVVQKILLESQALSLGHRYRYRFWILTEKSSFRNCLTTWGRLTEIASLVCWISLFFCLIATNQNLRTPASAEVNKPGLLLQAFPSFSPQSPVLFFLPPSFLSYPPPPPLTPVTQAIHLQILISLWHFIFLSKSSLPGRLSSAAVVVVVVDTWCSTLFDRLSWFSNRTGTSDKDSTQKSNNWLDQWLGSKLGTGGRV